MNARRPALGRGLDDKFIAALRRWFLHMTPDEISDDSSKQEPIRQAIVIVHGMGEHRPLETLDTFVHAALEPGVSGRRHFYSRPDLVTDSYESRVYLAPSSESPSGRGRPQTEFFEYHWAHLMQDNRLADLWPTFRRMMLQRPRRVPAGLRIVWILFWVLIVASTSMLVWVVATLSRDIAVSLQVFAFVGSVLGGALLGAFLTFVATKFLSRWLRTSFVDVVRYLDTSPRSYEIRRSIRKGMVDLLISLHQTENSRRTGKRYQRIVVAAHSLGAFIAYEGISYLWAHPEKIDERGHAPAGDMAARPASLDELERLGKELLEERNDRRHTAVVARARSAKYRETQRDLWHDMRGQAHPWRITDFVSLGAPMYFADRLLTRSAEDFRRRIARHELPTCPPQIDEKFTGATDANKGPYSYRYFGRHYLYEGAPFAVVRWTNLWFPAHGGFFGDWFGHRLAPLFGDGILDIAVTGNRPHRFAPGFAHAFYLRFPDDLRDESVTRKLHDALDLSFEPMGVPWGALKPPQREGKGRKKSARRQRSTGNDG